MPHVREGDRQALAAFLEREGRPAQADEAYVHESVWADLLCDRLSWEPVDDAPHDGTPLDVLYEDGTSETGAYWAETRQCMLGARAGERGPGWVSVQCGHLPVGDDPRITHFRMPRAVRTD